MKKIPLFIVAVLFVFTFLGLSVYWMHKAHETLAIITTAVAAVLAFAILINFYEGKQQY